MKMSEESKDCWQCRLTSGLGLLAGGAYVIHQSKPRKRSSRQVVAFIGYGLAVLGLLRLLAFPPFRNRSQIVETPVSEDIEQNEYIVGQFPTKFN